MKILDFTPKKCEETVVQHIVSAYRYPEAAGIFDRSYNNQAVYWQYSMHFLVLWVSAMKQLGSF